MINTNEESLDFINIFGKTFEIDRNIQAITGVFEVNTYSFVLFLI